MEPTEPIPLDPVMERLLRETMADFWRQNNLGQRENVIRKALLKAHEFGEAVGHLQAKMSAKLCLP